MTRRRPLPHAQIHLPPLGADFALSLVDILDRAAEAIWRAHGDRMGSLRALRAQRRCSEPEPSDDLVDDGDPNAPDDVDF